MLTNGKEDIIILHHNNTHTEKLYKTQARGKSPRHNTQAHTAPETKRDGLFSTYH